MFQTKNLPEYITATIKDWNHLLKEDEYKMVVINILRNLVLDEKVEVYAFCIMSNHIHIIWHFSPLLAYSCVGLVKSVVNNISE